MSAKVSEALLPVGGPAAPSERKSDHLGTSLTGLEPMVESETDEHETLIEYNPTSKMPIPVVLVWVCALIGLGVYGVTLYLPDLTLWYK